MRNAFADTVYKLARDDERLMVVVADISPAGSIEKFRAEFPERFVNVGVAEQAATGFAAGLAQRGMKPFVYTIASFALFRSYEFIRCDLAYQNLPVTVVGMGAGLSYSTLGGTHQAVEDVAVASAIPGMMVLCPCDPRETSEMVEWCARRESGGPVYLRLGKTGETVLEDRQPVELDGRLCWHQRYANEVVVLSYGPIAAEAREVAEKLGASFATVPVVSPLNIPWVAVQLARYSYWCVVEEAHGAPLARHLDALAAGRTLRSFSLDGWPHVNGTRRELLEHCGLTSDQILKSLREDEE